MRPYPARDGPCYSPGTGLAEPGTRYLDAIRAFGTNALYASICAPDWSKSLRDIGGVAVELICKFPLSSFKVNPNALPATARDIIVKVNGQEAPASGWTYNCPEGSGASSNGSISFTQGACPSLGATVQFYFQPAQGNTPPAACGARNPQGSCQTGERCGNCGYCERMP